MGRQSFSLALLSAGGGTLRYRGVSVDNPKSKGAGSNMDHRNLYFVGRNYAMHAKELGNETPKEPIVFLKPTHALAPLDGRTVKLDGTKGAIHYEVELVLRIGQTYDPSIDAEAHIAGLALGLDLTLRDVQRELQRNGLPWLPAKSFPQSALRTEWQPYPGLRALTDTEFSLRRNGATVQRGHAGMMLFNIPALISFIGTRYGLGEGDLIYTGTPAGVGPVSDGDLLECLYGEKIVGSCRFDLQQGE